MIVISDEQIWKSIQEGNTYTVVLVGPSFVRVKATYDPNLVVTMDKERLYEWFQKDLEAEAEREEGSYPAKPS